MALVPGLNGSFGLLFPVDTMDQEFFSRLCNYMIISHFEIISPHHDHALVIFVFFSCPSSLIAMYWMVRRFFFDRCFGHDAGSAETLCQGSA